MVDFVVTSAPVAPRSRGAESSRAAILAAAQILFAADGYVATGVRAIAERAGVNSALVGRYYGTKLQLFEAALGEWLKVAPLLTADRAQFGRNAAQLLCSGDGGEPLAMMLLASADPQARQVSIALLEHKILIPLAAWLGEPEGWHRAQRLNMVWSGYLNCARLLPMPAQSTSQAIDMLAWLAEATQRIVDEG